MTKFDHLLGKKPKIPGNPVKEETLFGHTLRVFGMAKLLTGLLEEPLKSMMQIEPVTFKQWEKAVWIASWMHDWGKANDHFQNMIRNPSFRQGVRHETISLIMAKEIETWLEPIWDDLPPWARCAALYSISGHHLKFPDPYADVRTGTEVTLLFDHPDFRHLLQFGCDFFQLAAFPQTEAKVYNLFARGNLVIQLKLMQRELDHDFDDKEKALISAAKATLMVADLAGSALPKQFDDPEKWLNDRLLQTLSTEQLEQVVSQKIGHQAPRPFQQTIRDAKSRTVLIEAGCGSGKTVAAYLWASRNAVGKRLFFCYPTTTTASEGFAGYMHDPDFDAILMHSRARTDYRLLENMPDPTHEESELRQAGLEALESWPIPVAVCTVHTVLGVLENVRRSIYTWPSLMQSVLVFDEIHAYSNRLFSYLLRFLKTFTGTQVLLMTATLPPARKKVLEEACKTRGGMEVVYGPKEREVANRYILERSTVDTATWSKQQQSRTSIKSYEGFDADKLDLFDVACRCLPNRVVVTKGKDEAAESPGKPFFVATSLSRGLISENIAGNRDWFHGFSELMMSKDQAKIISFERGGLMDMTKAAQWPYETDKKFVEAIHNAIRNRYGALASRATQSGEQIPFEREYERMRTGLMRAKNAQTLRAELSDFFARGRLNKTLRESWKELLPLFAGSDWQRAKDLALFALASYSGKGLEQIETAETNDKEEE